MGPAKTMFWNRLYRCSRGAALVEFALVAPMLVALALGVFEFGRVVQSYHAIDKGVRDAARYLSRQPPPACGGTVTNTAQAKNLAIYGNTAGSGSPVLAFWTDPATITVAVSCVATSSGTPVWLSPNGGTQIPIVTVTATVPYTDFGFLGYLGLQSSGFTTSHQELNLPE